MKIAVEGCCHGELDKIYETLAFLEQQNDIKVDLLLICGDFQSVRNRLDLQAMAVPPKYQKMNTFWKYYSGEKTAPVLTVFIGGNHEASNYLQELPYGGWVAPNIYYMGYANVLQFGGVRIAGLSGIYKGRDYQHGHYEHPPYTEDTKRSCYHIRNLDVFRLKQLQKPIDIILSHDWPRGIYNYGNVNALLKKKSFFTEEVNSGTLGSPPAEELLHTLKPNYWFSAHLHVKFAALVEHKLESGDTKQTKFLSLDKCLPRRKFLQILDIPSIPGKALELELDPEWLCILKATNHLFSLSKGHCYMPGPGSAERWDFSVSEADLKSLGEDFGDMYKIPENFVKTAPVHDPNQGKRAKNLPPKVIINPQTTLLCEMLGLTDPNVFFLGKQQHHNLTSTPSRSPGQSGDSSSFLEESSSINDSDFINSTIETSSFINSTFETTQNPDEISLDDLDDEDENDKVSGDGEAGEADLKADSPMTGSSEAEGAPDDLIKARLIFSNDELSQDETKDESAFSSNQSLSSAALDCQESVNVSIDSASSGSSPTKRSADVDLSMLSGASEASDKPKKFKRRNQNIYTEHE